jgi:hypothetical protein
VYPGIAAPGMRFQFKQNYTGSFTGDKSLRIGSALEPICVSEIIENGGFTQRINTSDKGYLTSAITQISDSLNDVFKEQTAT